MLVFCLLVAEYLSWQTGICVFKPLASTGFLAAAVMHGAWQTPYGRVLLAALCLSWLGDLLLLPEHTLLLGLASFLAAHLVYAAAFAVRGSSPVHTLAAVAVLGLPASLALVWLMPKLERKYRVPVQVYTAVLTASAALALGTGETLIGSAAICFFISDLAVARNRFVQREFVNKLWGVPLYYGAQLMYAVSAGAV